MYRRMRIRHMYYMMGTISILVMAAIVIWLTFVLNGIEGTGISADDQYCQQTPRNELNRDSCKYLDDDLAKEFTTLEVVDDISEDNDDGTSTRNGMSDESASIITRVRRSTLRKETLEKNFKFTDEKKYFTDMLDGSGDHDKTLFHKVKPDGYAESDRTKLLLFDVRETWYPPFTYRGLYGRYSWHKIPIETLLKKRNRSFMLLKHSCEHLPRPEEIICTKKEYTKLPSCKDDVQSPIDIEVKKARDSSLREFVYTNLRDSSDNPIKFPFMMSLPWDGTDILTVELLGDLPPPKISGGSVSGPELYLERIHIHYGANESVGSEHTLNGITYSMELQFIFTLRNSPDGRRQPTDPQYWDLLMESNANRDNGTAGLLYQNVHINALWVKVVNDSVFNESKADWNDKWNEKASEAFSTLARAARKFWIIHNPLTTKEGTQGNSTGGGQNNSTGQGSINNAPAGQNTSTSGGQSSTPNITTAAGAQTNSTASVQTNSTSGTQTNSTGGQTNSTAGGSSSSTASQPPKAFKYRAVLSIGNETLQLGAFFPPKVRIKGSRPPAWRDCIYYSYKGGITHPPCFGDVTWDIYDRPLYIPTSMWLNFLYVNSEFDDTKFVAGNYRLRKHVYIQSLDTKRVQEWTEEHENQKQEALKQIQEQDLRVSKQTDEGSQLDLYDYQDTSAENGTASTAIPGFIQLVSNIILYNLYN